MSFNIKNELVRECKRQFDNCLYTSVTLHIWLRELRNIRTFFTVAPIVFGALATWSVFSKSDALPLKIVASLFALLAGLFPAVYHALKFDEHLEMCERLTGEFTNLRDRFRQAAQFSSRQNFEKFKEDFDVLMGQVEELRSRSVTPPERLFKKAQAKIASGDYSFNVDLDEQKGTAGDGVQPST